MRGFRKIVFFSFFSYYLHSIDSPSSAYFCLKDSAGQVASGCVGPPLSPEHLQDFKSMYPDSLQIKPSSLDPKESLLNPLFEQDTSHMSNQMFLKSELNALKMKTMTNLFNWSRFKVITAFGGSVSEGQVLLPSRNWIYQAHRNKVKILATIFIPPNTYGGGSLDSQVEWMLNPKSDVAKNLVDLAKVYGIDGYFINGESNFSQSHKSAFADFITKIKKVSQQEAYPLHISWYVVGSVNSLMLLDSEDKKVTDSVFIDHYIWSSFLDTWNKMTPTQQASYNIKDIQYGAYNIDELDQLVGGYAKGASLGFFNFNAIGSPQNELLNDEVKQIENIRSFWGKRAKFFSAQFLNYDLPFSTWFNTGMGNKFFIKGSIVAEDRWNCIGLQSFLPQLDTLPDSVNYDFEEAYHGGSSLSFDLQAKQKANNKKTFFAKIKDKVFCKNSVNLTQNITLFNQMNMLVKGKSLALTVNFSYPGQINIPKYSDAPRLCVNGNICIPLTKQKKRKQSLKGSTWYSLTVLINQKNTMNVINSISLSYTESSYPLKLNLGGLHITESSVATPFYSLVPWKIATTLGNGHVYSWDRVPGALAYDLYSGGKFIAETVHNSYWLENKASLGIKIVPIYPG